VVVLSKSSATAPSRSSVSRAFPGRSSLRGPCLKDLSERGVDPRGDQIRDLAESMRPRPLTPRQAGEILGPHIDRDRGQEHRDADPKQGRMMNAPLLGSCRRSRRAPLRIFSLHVPTPSSLDLGVVIAGPSQAHPGSGVKAVRRLRIPSPGAPQDYSYSLDITTDSRNRPSHPRSIFVSLSLPVAKSTLCKSSPRTVLS